MIKRGKGAGYSGIENALFYAENTSMLYGSAQQAVADVITAGQDPGLTAIATRGAGPGVGVLVTTSPVRQARRACSRFGRAATLGATMPTTLAEDA